MIGSIIGAGLSAVGSIVGNAMSSKAARKAEQERQAGLDRKATRITNAYYANLNAPRYAAQSLLNQTAEKMKQRGEARQGQKNVIGGTTASVQAGNEADAETLGNVTQQAVAQQMDERRKASADYQAQMGAIEDERGKVAAEANQQRAQATAQATAGLINAGGQIAASMQNIGTASKGTASKGAGATNTGNEGTNSAGKQNTQIATAPKNSANGQITGSIQMLSYNK